MAIDRILHDPKFREFREGDSKTPLLYYYQRSYSTLHDGTVVEHGDGFTLHFVVPAEIAEKADISYQEVSLVDGVSILVGGPRTLLSSRFTIGRSKTKFTLESQTEL